jgi:hypothetical protein
LNPTRLPLAKRQLLDILSEAIRLVSLPENDFSWSSWAGAEEALAELTLIREQFARDDFSSLRELEIIFAPTGPMQEVGISSGWAKIYLALADRLDRAAAGLR